MLKIGEFSRLSRISIRMLRHYDEAGILKPQSVDPVTGYRFYGEQQLLHACKIQILRQMGFGVNAIGALLSHYHDINAQESFLQAQRECLLQKQEILKGQLRLLDSTMEWFRKGGINMGYEVALKTLPKRYVVSVRDVIPSYSAEGLLWEMLHREMQAQNIAENPSAMHMTVFYDGEYRESDVDIAVQVTVPSRMEAKLPLLADELPEVTYAGVVVRGPYEQITQVTMAIANWVAEQDFDWDGNYFMIYHVSPAETENPAEYVTEFCCPVKKKK